MEDFCDQSKSLPLLSSESVSKQKYLEIKTQFFSKADLYPSKSIWSNVDINQNNPKGHPSKVTVYEEIYSSLSTTTKYLGSERMTHDLRKRERWTTLGNLEKKSYICLYISYITLEPYINVIYFLSHNSVPSIVFLHHQLYPVPGGWYT